MFDTLAKNAREEHWCVHVARCHSYHFSQTWVWHWHSSCRLRAPLSVVIFYINNIKNAGNTTKTKGYRPLIGLAYLFKIFFIYFRHYFSEMLICSTRLVMVC